MKGLLAGVLLALGMSGGATVYAQSYPDLYIRGAFSNDGWACHEEYKFSRNENVYTLTVNDLNGEFKISDADWTVNYGSATGSVLTISESATIRGLKEGQNFNANNLHNLKISFTYHEGDTSTDIKFIVNGVVPDDNNDDNNDYPNFYVRGDFDGNQWALHEEYKFSRTNNVYTLNLDRLDGEFKISNEDWKKNFGAAGMQQISGSMTVPGISEGPNFKASNLSDVSITFTYNGTNSADIKFTVGGGGGGDDVVTGLSGTLPVLYINVKNEDGTYNNEIIDKNLAHKNYFKGEYWLDLNGCEWMAAQGAQSIGSKEEPLPLEIKARGNYTRKAFAKKPFKLKLGAKQKMLGLTKSKHFAILAHADDNMGYLRNFVGFNLGKRMELPWAPGMQPVEVVMNGDYRGLYFLTESIRIEADRVNITELDDNVSDPALVSGGYLIELDNYDEENQIRMPEKGPFWGFKDTLRITFDTPEEYSSLQQQFVEEQFTTMNNLVGEIQNSNDLWKYMDLDDAARYYLVEEIISHTEAYHGSTYMFRDRGEGQKWHFSPLWDCGNAFNGPTNGFFYNQQLYGNTWIGSLRMNNKFNEKVNSTWLWFMSNKYQGIETDIDNFVDHIREAAKADRARWKDAPRPTNESSTQDVVDNTDMTSRANYVKDHLRNKINWLKDQFGNYLTMTHPEPARDTTPAAELPSYITAIGEISAEMPAEVSDIYDIRGFRVSSMSPGEIYIVRSSNGEYTKVMGR